MNLWVILSGITLLAAWVAWVKTSEKKPAPVSRASTVPVPPAPDLAAAEKPVEKSSPLPAMLDGKIAVARTEMALKGAMNARSVEELLSFVRQHPGLEEKIRRFYPEGKIEPAGFDSLTGLNLTPWKGIWAANVWNRRNEKQMIWLEEAGDRFTVDWESWVAWSEMPWEKFLRERPHRATEFRVIVNRTSYYNYDFRDEKKWVSYRLDSPGAEDWIYGYAAAGSPAAELLQSGLGQEDGMPFILNLKFPENGKKDNQVIISEVIEKGWVSDPPEENH